jgi:hypothetical protein
MASWAEAQVEANGFAAAVQEPFSRPVPALFGGVVEWCMKRLSNGSPRCCRSVGQVLSIFLGIRRRNAAGVVVEWRPPALEEESCRHTMC